MRCPACDIDNPETARFCSQCGSRLGATCAHCQAPTSPSMRFCMSCGASLPTSEPDEPRPAPPEPPSGAERRRISVLFVDLENFTGLAESLDPEEVRNVQSRYFEVARSVIARYGGTIEKFIGDAVMAVWGAPVAREDDAERAVAAAMTVVDAVGRLGGAAAGRHLSARAAVTTGEAAVTTGATDQGMVAGDLVNVAARLQSRAPVGGVLVDAPTRELASSSPATFTRVRPLSLKGRATKLRAFRASPGRGGASRTTHSGPFVGRARELRELRDLFAAVVRERRSRLVSITGIAGIGKSRLVWELRQRLDAAPEEVAWHAGRAPAYGEDITFVAVAEMVRRRIRVSDDVPAELARRQLHAALEELVRDEGERGWMEPRIGVLLDSDTEAAFERDELFAAWRRFFERVSERTPAVLVFEDLQWADESLLDFIGHLAVWTADHPIMIVALARPELLDRRPSWGAGMGSFTAMRLDRLPDSAMRELLDAAGRDVDGPLIEEILERAGGVPLYAVEVARILTGRRGTGRRGAGAVTSPRDVGAAAIPDSLHGLIAARIDALPVPERNVLLAAALLGRRFRAEALESVVSVDASLLRERLESLVHRELLSVDDELGSPGRGEFEFVQDLVREVAYGTLARGERRRLHLAASRHFESRDQDDLADSLAYHLVAAHRLAPAHADAPRIARRAVAALRRSARGAIRLHLAGRALAQLNQALELNQVPEQRLVLLDEAAKAARAAGNLEAAELHLRELLASLPEDEATGRAARARAQLASVLLTAQRSDTALRELDDALGAIDNLAADAAGVELAAQLARARMLTGDHQASIAWSERAIDAATRLGMDAVVADLLVTRGTARFRNGDEPEGLADLERAVAAASSSGALAVELRGRNNLAWLSVADDPRATFRTARDGYGLAKAMGVGELVVQLADVACAAAVDTGDWEWALTTADDLGRGTLSSEFRFDLAATVATIRALRGDPTPLAELDTMAPADGQIDRQVTAGIIHARAWAAFAAGSFEEAHDLAIHAADGAAGAERAQRWILAARSALWRRDQAGAARAARALDEIAASGRMVRAAQATLAAGLLAMRSRKGALRAYDRAIAAWRALDLPLYLALATLDAGRLLDGDAPDAAEAHATLEKMGAHGLLAAARMPPDVSAKGGRGRSARSPRPSARTAAPTGAGRHRRPAKDHGPPAG